MSLSAKSIPTWGVVLGVVVVLGLWLTSGYNALVGLEESVNNSFAKIETQYQRRFDLIPNIVETVKGAANFEQSTLQAVVEARSAWARAGDQNSKIEAANGFDSAISRLLVTMEAYPTLNATKAFSDLNVELEGTENRIAFARNEFNDSATAYNKSVRTFPRNLIAKVFGFDAKKDLFEAKAGAAEPVKVDFAE